MDRLGTAAACGRNQGIDVEIAFRGRSRSEALCPVGEPDVQRPLVRVGVDGHAFQAGLAAAADQANRDLAPVRYENP